MIYRDDAKLAPYKMSDWMKDFANYWKNAEGRIKSADYLSQIQKALRKDRRTVSEAVSDLRERVGLDAIECFKKNSKDAVENKNASEESREEVKHGIPKVLEENRGLMNRVMAIIRAQPFVSVDAIKHECGYDGTLEDPEVEKFLKEVLDNERAGKIRNRDQYVNYTVDHVDTSDNKFLNYDLDIANKI